MSSEPVPSSTSAQPSSHDRPRRPRRRSGTRGDHRQRGGTSGTPQDTATQQDTVIHQDQTPSDLAAAQAAPGTEGAARGVPAREQQRRRTSTQR
ncbi:MULTISPECIES: hypothetical protein, partial [unclassified Pseudonocardia]